MCATAPRAKTVISDAVREVRIDVPRDREGTFEPQIVKERQRRLTDVDEIVLSLYESSPRWFVQDSGGRRGC
jgi:transposase-like protein